MFRSIYITTPHKCKIQTDLDFAFVGPGERTH